MKFIRKKGQVTIFIILGILIILSLFLYVYSKQRATDVLPKEVVPDDLVPMHHYIESCLYDVAKEGIIKMGMQGGFIEIPPDIINNPASYIALDPFHNMIKPYWYYKGQVRVPREEYLEYQISYYLQKNIPVCLDGFSSFARQFKVKAEDLSASVSLGDQAVKIIIDYPIEIEDIRTNKITTMKTFSASIPVRLKAVYELAKKIMSQENKFEFLEEMTIDMMASNPDIPFSGMEFKCGTMKWQLSDIKDDMAKMLFYNYPRIRIDNTAYAPFLEEKSVYDEFGSYTMKDINEGNYPYDAPPDDAYEFFNLLFDVGNEDPTLKAKITYNPQHGMDLVAIPSKNGVLSSDLIKGPRKYLKFLCINLYHFVYDMSYPVEVFVYDENSFNGEGYMFTFAFPVMINHNQGSREERSVMDFTSRDYALEGFCDNLGEKDSTIYVLGTYDDYMNMELPGVTINYECMKYECYIGETDADGGHYRLRANLPSGCVNPFIIANKTGYLTQRQQLVDPDIKIEMKRLKELEVKVIKHIYHEASEEFIGEEELGENEHAAIFIELNETRDSELSYNVYYPIPKGQKQTIGLVEDNDVAYDITIALLNDDEYIGGAMLEDEKLNLNELLQAKEIVFHVIDYRPIPITDKDKAIMTGFMIEGDYGISLAPELI